MDKAKDTVECDVLISPDDGACGTKYKLLHGDAELMRVLQQLQPGKDEVVLKGDRNSDTVLCTKENTYRVQRLETTNCLMLTPRSDGPDKVVVGALDHTQELALIPPRTSAVEGILKRGMLTREDAEAEMLGIADESSERKKPRLLYTTEEICRMVQASDTEVDRALQCSGAVQQDGRWMTVDDSLVDACLESLLQIGETFFDTNYFTEEEAHSSLGLHHPLAVTACLRRYCFPADSGEDGSSSHLSLDPKAVSRFRARQLFTVNTMWKETDFLEQWKACCPANVTVEIEHLRGLAIVKTLGTARHIKYFPMDSLPVTPKERFGAMFKEMHQWSKDDLLVYITPLVGPGVKIESLLSRFTREYVSGGKPIFTAF